MYTIPAIKEISIHPGIQTCKHQNMAQKPVRVMNTRSHITSWLQQLVAAAGGDESLTRPLAITHACSMGHQFFTILPDANANRSTNLIIRNLLPHPVPVSHSLTQWSQFPNKYMFHLKNTLASFLLARHTMRCLH